MTPTNQFWNAFNRTIIISLIAAIILLTIKEAKATTEYSMITDDYASEITIDYADKMPPPPPPPPPAYELIIDRSSYMMDVYRDDELIESRRVIVGKPGRTTPLVETEFNNIELNPTWDVPTSITDDMIRKFKRKKDPLSYIARNKYYFVGPDGNHIDPSTLDWTTISDKGPYEFKLKQQPGPYNVLGPVMFVLKDTGGVQMHGTANPELFKKDKRRFSSGCIRIDGAGQLAALLLDKGPDEFTKYRQSLGNKWIRLPVPVKVKVVE